MDRQIPAEVEAKPSRFPNRMAHQMLDALGAYLHWPIDYPGFAIILALIFSMVFGLLGSDYGLSSLFWESPTRADQFLAGLSVASLALLILFLSVAATPDLLKVCSQSVVAPHAMLELRRYFLVMCIPLALGVTIFAAYRYFAVYRDGLKEFPDVPWAFPFGFWWTLAFAVILLTFLAHQPYPRCWGLKQGWWAFALWPGRPGWLPTQVPHRSGLAHHAHPVPHLMNSRPARSVVVTWTWFRSRCTCQVSLQRLMRRHPLPSTGSLGLVPPLQRYYEVLRLPAAHFAALRFLRLAIPSLRPLFVPPGPGRGAVDQSGVGRRYLQPPCSMEEAGSPKFPEEPL